MPKTRYCNVLYMKNPMLEIYQKGADLQNNWYSIAEASMWSIACIPGDQKSTEKKNLLEKCVTQLLRKLDPTFINFWNSQTFRDLFWPIFTPPQNLLRSMSQWHWWPARMDEVPPGGGKPSLVIRTTQDMAWTKPGFYGMKLMVFFCSLLLKWAKQNSTTPPTHQEPCSPR